MLHQCRPMLHPWTIARLPPHPGRVVSLGTISSARSLSTHLSPGEMSHAGMVPQAFASNTLNRSMTDRRDVGFLQQAFPDALMLIVSSGRVLVTKEGPSLRWLRPFELQNLAYQMGSQGLHRDDGEQKHILQPACMAVLCHGLHHTP